MITHDELIFCLGQKYPNLVHGVDFWVGQEVSRDTGKQLEAARIIAWHVDGKPTDEDVAALIAQHGEAARQYVLGQHVRQERDRRLKVADAMFYKAMDSGDASKVQQVGQYRQALREVPEQPGFPEAFTWPDIPDTLMDLIPSDDQSVQARSAGR
ncbi:phage tail assembly chaperone [Ralstonia mannitolilytica]|uniref:XkdW family protein n=1 Tax=Ralstonia mannitolilytica TaxID=105219 RepID=UPI001F47EA6C|nr:phage tail assembly chaperone [Ralstonia mannitolilytica]